MRSPLGFEVLGTQVAFMSDIWVKRIFIQIVVGVFRGIYVLLTEDGSAT